MASKQGLMSLAGEATAIADGLSNPEISDETREAQLRSLARHIETAAEDAALTSDDLYREAHAIAQRLADEVNDNPPEDSCEILERLDEMIDGHSWTIYTQRAQQLIAASGHDDAMVEELGAEGVTDGTGINWSGLAYFALRAEVAEAFEIVTCEKCDRHAVIVGHSGPLTAPDGEAVCYVCARLFDVPDGASIVTYKGTITWHDEENPDGYELTTEDGPAWTDEEIRGALEYENDFGEAIADTVQRLTGGVLEASCNPWQLGSWFDTGEDQDIRTGASSRYSIHLKGFTPEQEEAIARAFLPRTYFRKGG